MNDEERQRLLSELAKRSPEEEAAAQWRPGVGGDINVGILSAWTWFKRLCIGLFAFGVIVTLAQCGWNAMSGGDEAESRRGPIPRQFQGTFNHYRCGSFDSEIRVTGSSVRIGVVNFEAEERVSSEENRVVLRGQSVAGGYVQSGERVTLRLTGDGSLVFNDGSPAERCD